MNTEPYGITTFCDDIRHELNGKLTLVGCYASTLNFNGPPPGVLPTFAALINLRVPTNIHFDKISLRVTKIEGEEETSILEANIGNANEQNESPPASTTDSKEEGKVLLMAFPCQWSPLQFSKAGQIKVRAYLDDDREVLLGALSVHFTEQTAENLSEKAVATFTSSMSKSCAHLASLNTNRPHMLSPDPKGAYHSIGVPRKQRMVPWKSCFKVSPIVHGSPFKTLG